MRFPEHSKQTRIMNSIILQSALMGTIKAMFYCKYQQFSLHIHGRHLRQKFLPLSTISYGHEHSVRHGWVLFTHFVHWHHIYTGCDTGYAFDDTDFLKLHLDSSSQYQAIRQWDVSSPVLSLFNSRWTSDMTLFRFGEYNLHTYSQVL